MSEQILDNLPALVDQAHQIAVDCGWWTDLDTGQPIVRDRGTLLMLCVTEVCEAAEAWDNRAMDDKLPHRRGVEVELADLLLRVFDFIPGLGFRDQFLEAMDKLEGTRVPYYGMEGAPPPGQARFFAIVRHLGDAMEAARKDTPSRRYPHLSGLAVHTAQAVRATLQIGRLLNADLHGALVEKMAFNRQREDHKIAHRRAAGGKKV